MNENVNHEQDQDQQPEKWTIPEIEGGNFSYFWVCSECRGVVNWKEDPCPHCGWRLDWSE